MNKISTPGSVDIKLWTPVVDVEEQALTQLKNIAALPWVFHHVAVMPDVHYGKGATVGSVVAMTGAVSPAAVGVDIGCVDMETEYLSPTGWKKISEYDGGFVMNYEPETGEGWFVKPSAYVKLPCEKFLRIKTKYGVDQKLSHDHKVFFAKYDRSYKFNKFDTILASDLAAWHDRTIEGFRGRFLTTFKPQIEDSVPWDDDWLRIVVMAAADGHFPGSGNRCRLRFKKQRKIERAKMLLERCGISYSATDGEVVDISYEAPTNLKSLGDLWRASPEQLAVIVDEVLYWDGSHDEKCFYTRDKASADFVSYAFAACGFSSVMRQDEHYRDGEIDYRVFANENILVGINGAPKSPIEVEPSIDGFKYCFTLASGFWVMRRNGVIAMTGNCGMGAIKTSLHASDLPDNLEALRSTIEAEIPVGFNAHATAAVPSHAGLFAEFSGLSEKVQDLRDRALRQLGNPRGRQPLHRAMLGRGPERLDDASLGLAQHRKDARRDPHREGKKARPQCRPPPGLLTSRLPSLAGTPEMEAYRHDLFLGATVRDAQQENDVQTCTSR